MTRLLKKISILFLFSLLFLFFTKPTLAYECASIDINPPDGTPTTNFVLTATGCAPSPGDPYGYFDVLVIDPSGNELYFSAAQTATETITAQLGGFSTNGSYSITLRFREGPNSIQDVTTISTSITEGTDGTPSQPRTLSCGSVCTNSGVTANCESCPEFCPAERIGVGTGFMQCGGDTPLCQSNIFNAAGINTALGCLPIEDINLTTSFLVQWSLGIGGGIGLFLIAISGVKIASTRGDPKRLQDARDTLSAAVAGIVMIVLSIFIIRFITETLLQLF